ncbi:MAG: cytochrome C oxidase subunit IV family protein [Akkermansiaceae bacterium]|nr:cytochrome C oxidase subunit IV family protein [Akkermansiaceae bacterium]
MKNITTLGVLLLLTAIAVFAANMLQDSGYLVLAVLGLGVVKLLLVAFQFMELKRANLFWKAALSMVVVLFLASSCIILH